MHWSWGETREWLALGFRSEDGSGVARVRAEKHNAMCPHVRVKLYPLVNRLACTGEKITENYHIILWYWTPPTDRLKETT